MKYYVRKNARKFNGIPISIVVKAVGYRKFPARAWILESRDFTSDIPPYDDVWYDLVEVSEEEALRIAKNTDEYRAYTEGL
ncbi:MAG: hypothetical protein LBG97_03015 [Coriobacteriales bacterium]|jgi:hypothetical protein|nr:hypothetical protein [Coriobacteriales bacterium]